LHCGSTYFVPNLADRAIMEINELEPDLVVCSGDLTTFGFQQEYAEAKEYLDRLECEHVVVVPGNHDSRNVGYIHFEELFGERRRVVHLDGVTVVAVDSSEPDLDHGVIGRGRYTSSCSTTTSCPCRGRAASGTSSTTPATPSKCSSTRA
jgi:3',5'-cyclic AMP phosphodiesterase CpdA